jgi:5-(carboxyamino)imidazole ribonucleotide synthase
VWLGAEPPSVPDALGVESARVHLYGKREPRAGRKMGHLSAIGQSPDEALDRVLDAYGRLTHAPAMPEALATEPGDAG